MNTHGDYFGDKGPNGRGRVEEGGVCIGWWRDRK